MTLPFITIQQRFESQVRLTPEATAVVYKEEKLSYCELNEKSNQVAHWLRSKGITRNDAVAIMMERSLEMIIGIFGILKAGGAYLPISANFPVERTRHILKDSQAKILLTDSAIFNTSECVVMSVNCQETSNFPSYNPALINESSDLAYIIYTSGSTGKPKGVMIEHCSLMNRIEWMQKMYPIDEKDTILHKTPFTFDVSVWELVWWSVTGAKVCILPPGHEKFPQAIIQTIMQHSVTIIHFVPSMLNGFLNYLEDSTRVYNLHTLKYVFSSGEALLQKHVQSFNRILNPRLQSSLVNLYGPTEATIDVSYYPCPTENIPAFIPIGKPIDNVEFYVVNDGKECAIGEIGELYIGGVCLARGYINNPDLTAENFILHPLFFNKRLYKSGDLVCRLADGNIQYCGRVDHQVKIRGLRIELGEIEYLINSVSTVTDCVVIPRTISESITQLYAFVSVNEGFSEEVIIEYLKRHLPDYMLPCRYIKLNEFPLSDNGKVDRKKIITCLEKTLNADKL